MLGRGRPPAWTGGGAGAPKRLALLLLNHLKAAIRDQVYGERIKAHTQPSGTMRCAPDHRSIASCTRKTGAGRAPRRKGVLAAVLARPYSTRGTGLLAYPGFGGVCLNSASLTWFGAAAVASMLVFYWLEPRSPWYSFCFGLGCVASSVYGWLAGTWPFGVVEAVWSVVAFSRCAQRFREHRAGP